MDASVSLSTQCNRVDEKVNLSDLCHQFMWKRCPSSSLFFFFPFSFVALFLVSVSPQILINVSPSLRLSVSHSLVSQCAIGTWKDVGLKQHVAEKIKEARGNKRKREREKSIDATSISHDSLSDKVYTLSRGWQVDSFVEELSLLKDTRSVVVISHKLELTLKRSSTITVFLFIPSFYAISDTLCIYSSVPLVHINCSPLTWSLTIKRHLPKLPSCLWLKTVFFASIANNHLSNHETTCDLHFLHALRFSVPLSVTYLCVSLPVAHCILLCVRFTGHRCIKEREKK